MLYPTERELIYVRRLIGRIVKSPIRLCPVIVRYLERAKVDGSNGLMPKAEPVHHQLFQVHGVAWRTGWRHLAITYNAILSKSINRFDVADDQAWLLCGYGISDMRGTYPLPPQLQV